MCRLPCVLAMTDPAPIIHPPIKKGEEGEIVSPLRSIIGGVRGR